jgi:hypothetical protein
MLHCIKLDAQNNYFLDLFGRQEFNLTGVTNNLATLLPLIRIILASEDIRK